MTQLAGGSLSESDQGTPGYRMGAHGAPPTRLKFCFCARRQPSFCRHMYLALISTVSGVFAGLWLFFRGDFLYCWSVYIKPFGAFTSQYIYIRNIRTLFDVRIKRRNIDIE